MNLYEILVLLLMGGGVWLWLDTLRAREIGMRAAQRACAEENLQFLDETVAGSAFSLVRDEDGVLRLRRRYAFEYSDTGNNRCSGSVIMLGHQVEILHLRPNLYVIPKTPEQNETLH